MIDPSPTPETDRHEYPAEVLAIAGERIMVVHSDFARKLERAIRETILENLHLADGDDCTLKRLKDAVGFDLDSSANAPSVP